MTTLAPGIWLSRRSEIAVCRNQDELVSGGANPPIADAGKPISERAFRLREQVAQQYNQLWRQAFPAANSAA
jgi:hypothetical protein